MLVRGCIKAKLGSKRGSEKGKQQTTTRTTKGAHLSRHQQVSGERGEEKKRIATADHRETEGEKGCNCDQKYTQIKSLASAREQQSASKCRNAKRR